MNEGYTFRFIKRITHIIKERVREENKKKRMYFNKNEKPQSQILDKICTHV